MRFAGIDFGWERQASGLALLTWNGSSLHLEKLDMATEPAAVVKWTAEEAGPDAVVAIDAPTVIANKTGMREADRLTHTLYGKYDAGSFPASRARGYWKRTTGLARALERRGFLHGDTLAPRSQGRWQIEVYPHAAAVQLGGLDRVIKYKRGTLAQRSSELARFRQLLLERLPRLTPRLALSDSGLPAIPASGGDLKRVEDQLDALLCAYVAAHYWYWGRARNDVLGDASRGYIVVPHRYPAGAPLAELRESYMLAGLLENEMNPDPIEQFQSWFEQAQAANLLEPNAMALATSTRKGEPSARIVLLKGLSDEGFVFYTNYESQKGRELEENPRASLLFYWGPLERQVRITGAVKRVSREESEAYFLSRPKGHRLGAWISRQSSVIAGREVLDGRLRDLETRYGEESVPLPPFWGGYRVRPVTIEFWQGRPNRLHDRIRYSRKARGGWKLERLSP